jgi:2-dehydropantoate 2-reductase
VGEIVGVPGGRDLGPAILTEATAVASAAGYPVPGDAIADTARTVTQAGSPVDSSLSRDVAEGRPAEVEEVVADLARRGAEHGVKTPLLDLTTMQLRVYNNSLRQPR